MFRSPARSRARARPLPSEGIPDFEKEGRLPIGPLIDVVFLLLVFFLCTLEFRSLEGRLAARLPKDLGPGPPPVLETVEVRIEVAAPGDRIPSADPSRRYEEAVDGNRFRLDGRRLRYAIGPRGTSEFEILRGWLVEQAGVARRPGGLPRPALLSPAAGVLHGEVVRVLDAVWESGFEEISFRGPPERGSSF